VEPDRRGTSLISSIAKDVRTVLQVAAFYELGSVADLREDLGDVYRPSYGAGSGW